MSINSLTNLINQTVPYAWDNSLSMMEFLGKIVTSMNQVIALVNEKLPDDFETAFYAKFRQYTTEEMDRIVANGQFQTILENILSGVTEFQNEITAARGTFPSLNTRLANTEQDLADDLTAFQENIDRVSAESVTNFNALVDSADLKARVESFIPNATLPLTIPTYDGSGETTHPKVLYFENGWNGYKFWMSHSPYPSADEQYENPSIVCSQDGITWVTPAGLSNPIHNGYDPYTTSFDSDPHILMRGAVMECWFRTSSAPTNSATTNKLRRRTSLNGVTWTAVEDLFEMAGSGVYLSPSIIYEDGKYKQWYVNGVGNEIFYMESADALSWSDPVQLNISHKGQLFWHIDIIKTGEKLEMIINSKGGELFYTYSYDNIIFSEPVKIMTYTGRNNSTYFGLFDKGQIYRSSAVKVGNQYYVFYSGTSATNVWKLGLSIGTNLLNLYGHDKQDNVLGHVIKYHGANHFSIADPLSTYPQNAIVYDKTTSEYALSDGWPEGKAGVIVTHNVYMEDGYAWQEYHIHNSNRVYKRYSYHDIWREFYSMSSATATLSMSANKSLANATSDKLPIDTVTFTDGKPFLTLANGNINFTHEGKYLLVMTAIFDTNATGIRAIRWNAWDNDTDSMKVNAMSSGTTIVQYTRVINATWNDYLVSLYGYQTSGAALNLLNKSKVTIVQM